MGRLKHPHGLVGLALLCLVAVSCATASPASAGEFKFVGQWRADDYFDEWESLEAARATGDVYVLNSSDMYVHRFSGAGAVVQEWPLPNTTLGLSNWSGIGVDYFGTSAVAIWPDGFIQQYFVQGSFIRQFGSFGPGNGQFKGPSGVDFYVDSSNNIASLYVADAINGRVQRLGTTGVYQSKWGSIGSGASQFKYPTDLTVDGAGNVYVLDAGNNRVQKFTWLGAFLTQWGSKGGGDGQFGGPGPGSMEGNANGLGVDGAGNVYVADTANDRVQKFDAAGKFLGKFGTSGASPGQFEEPNDVTVGLNGTIYVADSSHILDHAFGDRVEMFTEVGGSAGGGGDSGGDDGGGAASDRQPPRLGLSGKRRQRLRRTIVVTARCTNEPCTARPRARLGLRVRGGKSRTSSVTGVTKQLEKGKRARLRLVLSRRQRNAIGARLRTRRFFRLRIAVAATDGAGNSRTKRRTVAVVR